jgi:hypothetical protein
MVPPPMGKSGAGPEAPDSLETCGGCHRMMFLRTGEGPISSNPYVRYRTDALARRTYSLCDESHAERC